MIEQIHAVNRELVAAGVRKFACGISPAANAKTVPPPNLCPFGFSSVLALELPSDGILT
ncbi:MAG: hypothetical protein WBS17_01880 [Candidatus Acidiferrales bacterium]